MKDIKVKLSLVLDLLGHEKLDLYEGTLQEVDKFVSCFENHEEIRENYMFKSKIEEYLEERKSLTDTFKKESNKKGRIVITYFDDYGNCRAIPVIYAKDRRFLNEKYAFQVFREYLLLSNPRKLKELAEKKYYLLSRYEYDLLRECGYVKKYVEAFIRSLKSHDDSYLYIRSFLNSYREFDKERILPDTIKIKNGIIRNVNEELIRETTKTIEPSESICEDDHFFNKLIEEGDYETLYRYYSHEEITARSSNKEVPLGQTQSKKSRKKILNM